MKALLLLLSLIVPVKEITPAFEPLHVGAIQVNHQNQLFGETVTVVFWDRKNALEWEVRQVLDCEPTCWTVQDYAQETVATFLLYGEEREVHTSRLIETRTGFDFSRALNEVYPVDQRRKLFTMQPDLPLTFGGDK